jgi:predicted nuclease of predicted toxin-antitoxin system
VTIKLDENLPRVLAHILSVLGYPTDTVPQEGLAGRDDQTVWDETQRVGRFFITQDLDFSDFRKFIPGTHHGLLLVRLRDPSRLRLIQRVQMLFQTEDVARWTGCVVVATERKIRIRCPDGTT